MDGSNFANLGLIAWYNDQLDEFIEPAKIGNEYTSLRPDRNMNVGTCFSESDFYI